MKKYLLFSLLIVGLVLILYGCGSDDDSNGSLDQQLQDIENQSNQIIQVINSCDDSNLCTEDIFNGLTKECEHRRLDHCCGDTVCDSDERCDAGTHKTICSQDCPRQCPAFVEIDDWECENNCLVAPDHFLVDGDAKFNLNLQNIGELALNDVTSSFRCFRKSGLEFFTDRNMQPKSGVLFRDHFNAGQEKVYLSGEYYGNNKASYTFEVVGTPTENLVLDCQTTFKTQSGYYAVKDIQIRLSTSQ